MMKIQIKPTVGEFAENKDIARHLRLEKILPALERNEEVIVDFEGVEAATQSFIHALISDVIRKHGNQVLEKISFKNCNNDVQKIIEIVAAYMQESED